METRIDEADELAIAIRQSLDGSNEEYVKNMASNLDHLDGAILHSKRMLEVIVETGQHEGAFRFSPEQLGKVIRLLKVASDTLENETEFVLNKLMEAELANNRLVLNRRIEAMS